MAVGSRVRGGKKLKAFLRNARRAKTASVNEIAVGFFASSKYPNGIPVAAVAAWNEFGTRDGRVPERPFFRNAIKGAAKDIMPVLVENIDPKTMHLDLTTANKVGLAMVGRVQRSITVLRNPPNAPVTIQGGWIKTKTGKALFIKAKGSSNPLIDTGHMRKSVTHRVR